MTLPKINIKELIKGNKTYPTWSTGSCHQLYATNEKQNTIKIFYTTKSKRIISRVFPKKLTLSPEFCYVLGFLKGEGSNSLGKSNYRRFTITKSDPDIMKFVLKILEKNKLLSLSRLINKSCHLIHFKLTEKKVIEYWSEKLKLPEEKFKCFEDKNKTSLFGVCHIYISDVLLRRVVDLIQEKIMS
ncbi:MAG: hypothetical protein ABIH34_06305 [Nanoarchaeota archaeon]